MYLILLPLSKIYAAIMALRGFLYQHGIFKSYQSKLKIISIGNISAGGTGKTPLCIYICNKLKDSGFKVAVLSRGYKGTYSGVHLVGENDSADLCGDEPLLIHKKTGCPVVLCRDRVAGAKFIEEKELADIILLDDAFQHMRLRRDLDLVTINAGDLNAVEDLENNKVLPLGLLRESVQNGFARAGFFIVSNRMPKVLAKYNERISAILPISKPAINTYFEIDGAYSIHNNSKLSSPAKVIAFCAIANPDSFFSSLENVGFEINAKYVKSDHSFFSENDIVKMIEKNPDLPLICTEKDAVKLNLKGSFNVYQLKGSLFVEKEDLLMDKITAVLKDS